MPPVLRSITSHNVRNLISSAKASYFIAGFTLTAWSPFIPYVAKRLQLDEGALGVLLLCLGLGSVLFMPLTGMLTNRFGCRKVILTLAALGCLTLPLLTIIPLPLALALVLFCFGIATGGLDVVAAVQSMLIQNRIGRQIMPTMLAFYSVGSIAGPALVVLLLSCGLPPTLVAFCAVAVVLLTLFRYQKNLLARQPKSPTQTTDKAKRLFPPLTIIILGCMCFSVFLVEGGIMDWGALFLTEYKGFDLSLAGLGFALFSAAIALGRFMGAGLIRLVGGENRIVLLSCAFSFCSFLLTLFVLPKEWALVGFLLIGFGNANVIPILFSASGKQTQISTASAIAIVSSLGYSGILIGPALIGFIAHFTNLFFAFGVLGGLMVAVALLSTRVLQNMKN